MLFGDDYGRENPRLAGRKGEIFTPCCRFDYLGFGDIHGFGVGVKRYNRDYFIKRGNFFPLLKGFIFALFIRVFLRPKSLLDVGCALGEVVYFATKLSIKSEGVDISNEAISQQSFSLRSNCKIGSVLNLPFQDKSFDVVSGLALLEHIPERETVRALEELLRVSKKFVLLQICVKDNPFEGKHYLLDQTHVNVQQSNWWIKTFDDLGLKFRTIPRTGLFIFRT